MGRRTRESQGQTYQEAFAAMENRLGPKIKIYVGDFDVKLNEAGAAWYEKQRGKGRRLSFKGFGYYGDPGGFFSQVQLHKVEEPIVAGLVRPLPDGARLESIRPTEWEKGLYKARTGKVLPELDWFYDPKNVATTIRLLQEAAMFSPLASEFLRSIAKNNWFDDLKTPLKNHGNLLVVAPDKRAVHYTTNGLTHTGYNHYDTVTLYRKPKPKESKTVFATKPPYYGAYVGTNERPSDTRAILPSEFFEANTKKG